MAKGVHITELRKYNPKIEEIANELCALIIKQKGSDFEETTTMEITKLSLLRMNAMCEESLDPETFEKWKDVEKVLKTNRIDLDNG